MKCLITINKTFYRLTASTGRTHISKYTVNDLINAHSQINAPYVIDAPL